MTFAKRLIYPQIIAVIITIFLSIVNRWKFFPTLAFSLIMSNGITILINSMITLTWKRMRMDEKNKVTQVLYWTILIALSVCIGTIAGVELYQWIIPNGYIHISRKFYPLFCLFNGLISIIATVLQIAYDNLKARIERNVRENEELRFRQVQAQLIALQAKINPHFLFNTLNTMLSLLQKDPDKVERMILNLSDIYRRILRLSEIEKIPLADEMTLLREYLEIEKIRLGDRLSYVLEIEPNLAPVMVLPLLLEPLVENAVLHGIGPKPHGGHIAVRAVGQDSGMRITVADDGVGLDPATTRDGFGIRSVRERLNLAYAGKARMNVHAAAGGGTTIWMEIPIED